MDRESGYAVLAEAAVRNGLDPEGARVVGDGKHLVFALAGGVVGRIGERGSSAERAGREIEVSRWLTSQRFAVVREAPGLIQPTVVAGHPVTWWMRLPEHRTSTLAELGAVLRELHALPVPSTVSISGFSPLRHAMTCIQRAQILTDADRAWLMSRADELRRAYAKIAFHGPLRVIHGDAWRGNVVVPDAGPPLLLDLGTVRIGPVEWDLIPTAVDHTDLRRISSDGYASFVDAYGFDVTESAGYRTLVEIYELRLTAYALVRAADNAATARVALHRLACLRGEVARPGEWKSFQPA
jgi:aminoglycoside phosphotransferase (APT) family kinase protein